MIILIIKIMMTLTKKRAKVKSTKFNNINKIKTVSTIMIMVPI